MKWSDYTSQLDTVHAPESLKARIRALEKDADPLDAPKMKTPRRSPAIRLPHIKIWQVAAALALCVGIAATAPVTMQLFHVGSPQSNESSMNSPLSDGFEAGNTELSTEIQYDTSDDMNKAAPTEALARNVSAPKIVYTAELYLESTDYEQTRSELEQLLAQVGGYAQQMEESTRNEDAHYLYGVYRIPAEHYRTFLDAVADSGNLVHWNEHQDDVTSQYIDTQAHLTALTSQRDRLLALQQQAEDLTALLEIEKQLTEVQYKLENWQQQLNELSNQVDYCTVNLTLEEVTTYTPGEQTLWEKISAAFVDAVKNFGDALSSILLWFIGCWPWLAALGIAAGIAHLVHKKRHKPSAK